ncbi:MAG: reverse transcriptase family protein, partial [Candidatus Thiodiazotropha sp.]
MAEVAVKPIQVKQKHRKIHLFSKADWTMFRSKMKNYQAKFLLEHSDKSVDQLWSDLTDNLEKFTDECIPSKVIKGKPSLPWISHEIKRLIRRRDKFYKAYRKTGNSQLREKYLSLRHQIRKKIKDSHEAYLEGMLGLDDNINSGKGQVDSKKLFQFLKNSRTDQHGIPPMKTNDTLYTDMKDKANILNAQFQSVFTPLSPLSLKELSLMKVQDLVDDKVIDQDHLPEEFTNSTPVMPDIRISETGILHLLKNLKPKKAAGPDRIKPVVLQELREELAPILKVLFERSLDSGTVPSVWTSANVSPLFKKGDKSTAANYRPISLTCILCKVMEHIIASNIVKHLDSNGLMYDLQHGFRERRSCETQLASLIEDLARNSSQGKQTDLILLDFSKAFDKVNHSKLLLKLHSYGIRNSTLRWIQAFLSNRQQRVVVEGEESDSVPVPSGVPQGSVLGPILFLVYINDLPQDIVSQVRLFADDTAIYLTLETKHDSDHLQKDLDRLQAWETRWDMEFNPSKCQVVRVTSSRAPINTVYTLHGQVLEAVTSARYLGVDISNNLSWNTHVDRVAANANRSLGFVKRNLKTKSPKIREMAYQTLVRPQLEYASAIWDPHTKEKTHKIEMVQRRAARWTMSDYARTTSVTSLLQQLGWQTLEERRNVARLCLFYKIVNGIVAVPL